MDANTLAFEYETLKKNYELELSILSRKVLDAQNRLALRGTATLTTRKDTPISDHDAFNMQATVTKLSELAGQFNYLRRVASFVEYNEALAAEKSELA